MIEPKYMNHERYMQMFEAGHSMSREEKKLRCQFCGGTKHLYGLPDGTVACEGCSTDLEGETEWEGN